MSWLVPGLRLALIGFDWLAVIAAGLLAYWWRFAPAITRALPLDVDLSLERFLPSLALVAGLQVLIFAFLGLYRMERPKATGGEFGSVFWGTLLMLAGVAVWTTLTRQFFESRFIILVGWVLVIILVSLVHLILRSLEAYLITRKGLGIKRVLVIGQTNPGRSRELQEIFKNFLPEFQVIGQTAQINLVQIQELKARNSIDEIFLADLSFAPERLKELFALCQRLGLKILVSSGVFEGFRTEVKVLGDILPVLEIKNTPLEGWGWIGKRVFDLTGAGLILMLASPLFLMVPFFIKWDSSGSVMVRLKRAGLGGRPFYVYKFRSMVKGADKFKLGLQARSERPAPLFKIRNDPRITRVGRFLRRFRIDELPQVFNVLKGEMSLVGPRPHELEEIQGYQAWQERALTVPPGITGLAQISGSARLHPLKESELDIYYLENWSLGLDISILLRTIARIFKDPGAF
jgi:exopolysaccharide biosynthesis polyprenyl glycosylphosphotransferase